jgi:uncharacterized protein YdaT
MPWTKDDPPPPAKNWSDSEKEKCVKAANAVLREGGKDEEAIYACIHAAGKTKNPGGKKQSVALTLSAIHLAKVATDGR